MRTSTSLVRTSTPCALLVWLDGRRPALARSNADHVLDCRDEDLAVADPSGARRADDRIDDLRDALIRDEHGDLHLGQEVDDVLRAPVELRVALLPPESFHLLHGHAVDTGFRENVLHLVQLEWLDDRVDPLHRSPLLASRRSREISNDDAIPPAGGRCFSPRVERVAESLSRRSRVRVAPPAARACALG